MKIHSKHHYRYSNCLILTMVPAATKIKLYGINISLHLEMTFMQHQSYQQFKHLLRTLENMMVKFNLFI
jgi:hypothetical protein